MNSREERERGTGREREKDCSVCERKKQAEHDQIKIIQVDVTNQTKLWTESLTLEISSFDTEKHNAMLLHMNIIQDDKTIHEKIDDIVDDLNQTKTEFLCVAKQPGPKENIHFNIYTCKKCFELKDGQTDLPSPETYFLFQHINISTLCYGENETKHSFESKNERRRFLRRLQILISALRNSNGGAILIHIAGLSEKDTCLEYFNELVDDGLNEMIDDDELFTDVYKKSWLSERFPGVVQIVVKPTSLLSTLNFRTKLSLDNKIVDPLSHTVFHFLKTKRSFTIQPPKLLGTRNIHESRQVQVKSLYDADNPTVTHSATAFSMHIWNDLRLKEYISAFSKIDDGGSFFVGISEKEMIYGNEQGGPYKSKEFTITGFTCNWNLDENHFRKIIQEKVNAETLILRFDGQVENTPESTIDLAFYNLGSNKYVLEIAVAAVNGLVFYDTDGPESYELTEDNRIRRFLPKEWFDRLHETWENE